MHGVRGCGPGHPRRAAGPTSDPTPVIFYSILPIPSAADTFAELEPDLNNTGSLTPKILHACNGLLGVPTPDDQTPEINAPTRLTPPITCTTLTRRAPQLNATPAR